MAAKPLAMDIEAAPDVRQPPMPRRPPLNIKIFGGIGMVLCCIGVFSWVCFQDDIDDPPSVVPGKVEVQPPWWIIQSVVPDGPEIDKGRYSIKSFSKEQQEQFGVDKQGKVLSKAKFEKAIADLKVLAKPPWWITVGVQPQGEVQSFDGMEVATFSKSQQEQFGIDENGAIINQDKFDATLASLITPQNGLQALPPWWIRHNVAPRGKGKNMEGWTAIAFTKEQQKQFGIDELGVILDSKKYEAAIEALTSHGVMMLPPWWITDGITPEGPNIDMGGWTASSFSDEQQKQFGIDSAGIVTDKTKFGEAIKTMRAQRGDSPPSLAIS